MFDWTLPDEVQPEKRVLVQVPPMAWNQGMSRKKRGDPPAGHLPESFNPKTKAVSSDSARGQRSHPAAGRLPPSVRYKDHTSSSEVSRGNRRGPSEQAGTLPAVVTRDNTNTRTSANSEVHHRSSAAGHIPRAVRFDAAPTSHSSARDPRYRVAGALPSEIRREIGQTSANSASAYPVAGRLPETAMPYTNGPTSAELMDMSDNIPGRVPRAVRPLGAAAGLSSNSADYNYVLPAGIPPGYPTTYDPYAYNMYYQDIPMGGTSTQPLNGNDPNELIFVDMEMLDDRYQNVTHRNHPAAPITATAPWAGGATTDDSILWKDVSH
jgi:hypothetical protein